MSILLLVGPSGVGKTTACQRIVELARSHGLSVAGILSLPVYDGQVKSAINLHDITSGRERTLARVASSGIEPDVGVWSFETEAIMWGQELLGCLPACDLLVIDEIGPMEIKMGKGLTNALAALIRANFRLAVVPLRPLMIEALLKLVPGRNFSVYWLDKDNRDMIPSSTIVKLEKVDLRAMIYVN